MSNGRNALAGLAAVLLFFLAACGTREITLAEYRALSAEGLNELLAKTTSKPYRGEAFVPGVLGGVMNSVITADPKSFNHLIAETDMPTASIVGAMTDYLIDYNPLKREWVPRIASPEIIVDEVAGRLDVIYTLRGDLYWSYYNSDKKVRVTSDDVVFWYNEISGDPDCGSSSYYQQYLLLEDGSEAHVDIEKLDERRFVFHFPRIVAEPLLSTNMDFGPRHVYEEAKKRGGAAEIKDLYRISTDPALIPSMGKWFLVEYRAGQRLVFKRNPDYWERDAAGLSVPYYEEEIVRIIPEENTQLLMFKNGETDSFSPRPQDLEELVNNASGYTVFDAEGSLGAAFWTFNQNPIWKETPEYSWFTVKEFRQAMSCLLNRERIISAAYRGLAEAKTDFFPPPNPFYNPSIRNTYLYDPVQALRLLSGAGFRLQEGVLRDRGGVPVEFDLTIASENTVFNDIASIIRDELSRVGIKLNIRVMDFQKLVDALFSSFVWDSVLIGLSGGNIFPSQGSNVWPSSGNLHMWYPNQESPATEWEARIDWLYNEGVYTIDRDRAQKIWDEYQALIIEQCPVISLFRSRSFYALRNRWDFSNFYFDNLNGIKADYLYLKP
ncbi:MAG: ABC transporter substrate-binding protein [Treponema sp.]|jgi:peptide/nickel transport system substrate-binding protein|nr:ABC transporter substrate-binding protein [Treponema sp.]